MFITVFTTACQFSTLNHTNPVHFHNVCNCENLIMAPFLVEKPGAKTRGFVKFIVRDFVAKSAEIRKVQLQSDLHESVHRDTIMKITNKMHYIG